MGEPGRREEEGKAHAVLQQQVCLRRGASARKDLGHALPDQRRIPLTLDRVHNPADALVDVRKRQEFRQQQELLVNALADASQVATMRYEGGVASYLEVLDTERQYFDAEVQLVQAKRDESLSVIQLYKALGGGWQADATATAAASTKQ